MYPPSEVKRGLQQRGDCPHPSRGGGLKDRRPWNERGTYQPINQSIDIMFSLFLCDCRLKLSSVFEKEAWPESREPLKFMLHIWRIYALSERLLKTLSTTVMSKCG